MKLWSELHLYTLLPTTLLFIGIGILLGFSLRNKDEKIRLIPIKIISVLIVVLEILKQIFSLIRGYDLFKLPLHFCSLLVFLLPLFAFYEGNHAKKIRAFTTITCAVATLVTVIFPTIVYEEGSIKLFFKDFLCFHAVVFHSLIILSFILIIALKLFCFNTKSDIKNIFFGYLIYSLFAGSLAQILKTNFNSFYFCEITWLNEIRLSIINAIGGTFGQVFYVILVYLALVVGAILTYFILKFFIFILEKLKSYLKK